MQNNRSIFAHAIPRSRRALARTSFLKSHMTDSKNSMQTLNRGRVAHGYFGNQGVMGCAMTTCFRHGVSANMDTPLSVKNSSSPCNFFCSHNHSLFSCVTPTVAQLKEMSTLFLNYFAWWHDYAMKGQIRFLRGRLKFGGAANSAPFPSAVVVFDKQNGEGDAKR